MEAYILATLAISILFSLLVVQKKSALIERSQELKNHLHQIQQNEATLLQSQKLDSIGQLAAGIAHEINTPIQYIRDNTVFFKEEFSNIDRLLSDIKELQQDRKNSQEIIDSICKTAQEIDISYITDEVPNALAQTLEGAETVTKIVRSMKDFSHPGSEEKCLVNLNRALESTIAISKHEWKYVADVELDLEENLPSIHGFAGELNQALLNIVINAAHAIEEVKLTDKGLITVRSSHNDDNVEVQIIDTGIGIPEEIKTKIFDPFFTTKEVGKGTGQGLPLVYATVVDRHSGTIDIDALKEGGTSFTLRFPRSL